MDSMQYYKLKQKYQEKFEERKKVIKNNEELSLKAKQAKMKRLVKKCVNCGKSGGTTFEEANGMLKAVCASKTPCELNIVIRRKTYDNMRLLEHKNNNLIDNLKLRIIMTKLDYLYGYTSSKEDVVDKFNGLKEELALLSETQLINNKKYSDIISGIHREPLLIDAMTSLEFEIQKLKEMYDKYDENTSHQYINEMTEQYLSVIVPLVDKIRKMKYNHYVVEHELKINDDGRYVLGKDLDSTIHTLVSHPYSIYQLEQERK